MKLILTKFMNDFSSFNFVTNTRIEFLTKRFIWSCTHQNESKIPIGFYSMNWLLTLRCRKPIKSEWWTFISIPEKHDWYINISAFRLPLDIPIYIKTVEMSKYRCHSAFTKIEFRWIWSNKIDCHRKCQSVNGNKIISP